jgi:hypothetical protein
MASSRRRIDLPRDGSDRDTPEHRWECDARCSTLFSDLLDAAMPALPGRDAGPDDGITDGVGAAMPFTPEGP